MVLNKANTPQQKSQNKNKERCLPLNASPCIEKKGGESDLSRDTVTVCDYSCLRHGHIQKGTQTR